MIWWSSHENRCPSLPHRYKLIRRRVVWLIGQWIPVKFKSDLRPVLYEIILNLMQDPDLVVSSSGHQVDVFVLFCTWLQFSHSANTFGNDFAFHLASYSWKVHALASSASTTGLNPHLPQCVRPNGRIAPMVAYRLKVKAENNLGGMCNSLCPQAVCIPTGRY